MRMFRIGFVLLLWTPLAAIAASTTVLTVVQNGSPASPMTTATPVTLKAIVTADGIPVTSGTVNFCDAAATDCTDTHFFGTAQLTGAGEATTRLRPGVGTHIYKAVFLGTHASPGSSSGAATVTVGGVSPSATVIVKSGPATGYILTATTGGNDDTAPTGTVTFLNTSAGGTQLGSASLGQGVAGLQLLTSSEAAGVHPHGMATGDFNNDGVPDLVMADGGPAATGQVTVLLGKGDGTFVRSPLINTDCPVPSSVAVGDFNSDGNLDVAVTNAADAGNMDVFLGHGDGTFQLAASLAANGTPLGVAVGDFNQDGNLDLAAATGDQASVPLFLGNGDGTFRAATGLSTGDAVTAVVTADFNNDGKPDIAAANQKLNTISIFLGNGDGTFTSVSTQKTGRHPVSLAATDFNHDGKPDLAVVNTVDNTVRVLLGNGKGGFAFSASLPVGFYPSGVVTTDLNGDGRMDMVVGGGQSDALAVFTGNGNGTFSQVLTPPTGKTPASLVLADFNGDGKLDIAAANSSDNSASVLLAFNRTASASIAGITVPGTSVLQNIVASYAGDRDYDTSVSAPTRLGATALSMYPTNIDFRTTYIGTTAGYRKVTLTNSGESVLDLQSISIAGTTSPYSWGIREQTCGATLAVGAACSFSVAFRPTSDQYLSATVFIHDNADGSPQKVTLFGEGAVEVMFQLTPGSVIFPPAVVGTTAAYQQVVLTNTSTVYAPIDSIAISDTKDPYAWGIRDQNCPGVLGPGEACSFAVAFRPTSVGNTSAAVTVVHSATGPSQKILLQGMGR